ncbi:MAG: hypothetical protein HONBIEJF_00218 [Fimbriimonadaceae bacterium]|nr:hypothetical protein [Fimbriimonadaceae bacterium]
MPITLLLGLSGAVDTHQLKLKPVGEYRVRFERRQDRDFDDATADNRSDLLQRFRIGLDWQSGPLWSGSAQYQYAHGLVHTPRRNFSDDSSLLFVLDARWKHKDRTVTAGRQKMSFGSERLVATSDWGNASRTFDGLRYQDSAWDIFGARIGAQQDPPPNARIFGAGHKWRYGMTALLFKRDSVPAGQTNVWTLDHIMSGKLGMWAWDGEVALQTGRTLGLDHEAWALHVGAGTPLTKATQVYVEWNAASGGSTPTKVRTFDALYGSNHKFYGIMDLFGLRNLNQFQATLTHSLGKGKEVKLRGSYNTLRDNRDFWYASSGRPNNGAAGAFRDITGGSGNEIGWEFDVEGSWKLDNRQTLAGGIGFLVPGRFVRAQTKQSRTQIFFFASYTFRY